MLLIQSEVSTASAMNSGVLPVAPGGCKDKCTNIKNHLCPRHRGANCSQIVGLFNFQPPYVAGNSRDFYCSVTNVKQAQKTQSGLPRPPTLFK
jgi:hypothetical protein